MAGTDVLPGGSRGGSAAAPASDGARPGMRWIPGGVFRMGSEDFYPEERPVRQVAVDGFWIDAHPVTVAQYRRFVRETGYTTTAERPPAADAYPDADPALLVPGSLVFRTTAGPVDLRDYRNWWEYLPGASPGRTCCWTASRGPRRWGASRRTGTDCAT